MSVHGETVVDQGDSECVSEDGNVAIAVNDSDALAGAGGGDGNVAVAVNDSDAAATFSDDNTAIAVNGSDASAFSVINVDGDNIAIAVNDSDASAGPVAGGQAWPETRGDRTSSTCCLAWSETWVRPK